MSERCTMMRVRVQEGSPRQILSLDAEWEWRSQVDKPNPPWVWLGIGAVRSRPMTLCGSYQLR
jgi:hypothetical protein